MEYEYCEYQYATTDEYQNEWNHWWLNSHLCVDAIECARRIGFWLESVYLRLEYDTCFEPAAIMTLLLRNGLQSVTVILRIIHLITRVTNGSSSSE